MGSHQKPQHLTRTKVLACSLPDCRADEEGCTGSGCKDDLSWSWMYHDDFRERFGRCPRGCRTGGWPEPVVQSWRCEVCRKTFGSKRGALLCEKRHEEQHEDERRFRDVQNKLESDTASDSWIVLMTEGGTAKNAVVCVLSKDDKPTSDLNEAKIFEGMDEVAKWEADEKSARLRGSWLCTPAPLWGPGVPPLPWEA